MLPFFAISLFFILGIGFFALSKNDYGITNLKNEK
tara:strand:+ start:132 stop:236 length:105 start_codon:yes stop_codon:yes gene_type:complete